MSLGSSIVSAAKTAANRIAGNDEPAQGNRWAAASLAQSENRLPDTIPEDKYWVYSADIETERWNQQYPYQLIVVEARQPQSANAKNIKNPDGKQNCTYVPRRDWQFTLPISPSDISMRTNFAVAVTAMIDGVVRESNGARFRRISFSGTTGVLPLRDTASQVKTANLARAIFAGTVGAAQRTATSATSIGQTPTENNLVSNDDTTTGTLGGKGTGYYQFRLLQQFLESYAAATSVPSGKDLRLALCMWKDQAVYLVEPEPDGFTVRRNEHSPYEYLYELVFRAYRRITLNGQEIQYDEFVPAARDPNAMAAVLNALTNVRQTLSNARAAISSVVPDIDQLFEPLRQAIMCAKDAVGVSLVAADLPANLLLELKQPVIELMGAKQFAVDAAAAFSGVPASTRAALQDLQNTIRQFAGTTGKSTTLAGNLSSQTQSLQNSAHPVHKVFANPQDNQDFFLALKPNALHLPARLAKKIQEEQDRIRSMTRLDWEAARDKMMAVLADFEAGIGEGSSTFDATFGRQTKAPIRAATADDWDTIFAINEAILQLNKLTASGTITQSAGSGVEYFATLANRSGIPFAIPRSKFAVPFPFGSTLERLAGRYLGDPDRWMEIAVLNNLQEPYIDEQGFDVPLIVTGNGNQVIVASAKNLYIGQPVWIGSSTTSTQRRRITDIRDLGFNQVVLTLDGDPTLDQYTTLAKASIHAYLPNTINSQMLVYIPSQVDPANEDNQTKSIPGIDFYDRLLHIGGVDLLLTSDNDIAWTPDGDCKLAVGLTNIVQYVRIALGIQKGQLIRHPEFGLGIQPGTSIADLSPDQLLKEAQKMFGSNPMFSGLEYAAINVQGPVASIAVSVGIAGTDQFLPITATVEQWPTATGA